MFHFVNKNIIRIIFIFVVLNNILYGGTITYKIRFIKLLEYGKQDNKFKPSIENTDSDIIIKKDNNSHTSYPYFIEVDKHDIGKKIKIKLNNENNWIIISNGEFVIPKIPPSKNITKYIDIKLVRKFTELYFDIFSKYKYSVQVLYTKNKDIALQTINDLIKDNYDAYYEAVPIIPHRGYMYKVKVGDYHDLEKAKKKKKEIIHRYSSFKDSFVTARLQDK